MKTIQELLALHKIPGVKEAELRRICADTASMLLKTKLPANLFSFKTGELSTKISPLLKTELLMRQSEYSQLLSSQGVTLTTIR
jgi:hypothetical protein